MITFIFTTDELDRIVAALSLMRDMDDANEQYTESQKTRKLIDMIQDNLAEHVPQQ